MTTMTTEQLLLKIDRLAMERGICKVLMLPDDMLETIKDWYDNEIDRYERVLAEGVVSSAEHAH